MQQEPLQTVSLFVAKKQLYKYAKLVYYMRMLNITQQQNMQNAFSTKIYILVLQHIIAMQQAQKSELSNTAYCKAIAKHFNVSVSFVKNITNALQQLVASAQNDISTTKQYAAHTLIHYYSAQQLQQLLQQLQLHLQKQLQNI